MVTTPIQLQAILLAAVLALIPARIAQSKGRSFAAWWLYGWLFLIIAVPHALLLRPRAVAGADTPPDSAPALVPCDRCHQQIRSDTPQCPFCGIIRHG
jgi:hypothetical protein